MNGPSPRPVSRSRSRRAFTLVEVVLAIGVFSVAGISSVALFSTIINSASTVTARDNAIRLNGALEGVLQNQTFTQVYQWYQQGTPVYAYTYLAQPPDGTTNAPAVAAVGSDPTAGVATVRLTPSIHALTDTTMASELGTLQGHVYRVVFTLSPANPIQGTLPSNAAAYTNAAVLALTAKFYVVTQPKAGTQPDPSKVEAPVHTCTMTYLTQQ